MILTAIAFAHLAAQCGPSVHVDTLASVAQAESQLNTLAIHDNTTGRTYHPTTSVEACKIATDLVSVKRHSADLGIMQVNSANLGTQGLSLVDAFDACQSITAGARVIVAGYQPPVSGTDVQPALLRAVSRYNTGKPDRGFTNGYVQRVQSAASQVVPAIRLGTSVITGLDGREGIAPPPSPPPPSWDVFRQARYQRELGRILVEGHTPTQPQATQPTSAPAAKVSSHVQLQAAAAPTSAGQ